MKVRVVWSNTAGQLDAREVEADPLNLDESPVKDAINDMVRGCDFQAGDTIDVVEISEDDGAAPKMPPESVLRNLAGE